MSSGAGDHKRRAPADGDAHAAHGPYWTRAHRDWRMWVGAVLMAFALGVYVLSGDLGWLYRGAPHQMMPFGHGRG